jgi:hypothetical protein
MKSVNLDIWSTQTMSYEVSQLRYLINTNNEYYNPIISDFIRHCLCWSYIQVDWRHRTLFVLIRYLSWMTSYDIVYVAQIFKHKQCLMKSVNLDIWSTQTMNITIQLYLINTNNFLWSQSTWISDQYKACHMKSVNLDIWSTRTLFVLIRYPSWLTS